MNVLSWLNDPAFHALGKPVPYSDMFGNILATATIGLAMRRSLWSWPVQITGSLLLIAASLSAHLGGNATRQVVIIVAALWGWARWNRDRRDEGAVKVRFATNAERLGLVAVMGAATVGYALFLDTVGWSWAPWPDAYIFVGSAIAMYAQAKGWVEFWFVWIAVDMVGIPLQINSGLIFSALVYGVMFVMVLFGLRDWWQRSRVNARQQPVLEGIAA
ncbi:nicotinamide mononucleotide transporter family protein [Wenjunlia tyrosinilytica]|uniref:Membrane protein n=1 Tax=Wenjunlia tyrosinilytica TaxID=1544741 RepID=A0A918DTU0_9ACTN|nr:nicotinamide mononucleotide transporter family protein [Wenjunlia tyrosinilytica]GGO82198.1 membrane protein [Wenjunlia tyrosinilytica]